MGDRREYADGTWLEQWPGPFSTGYRAGRAMCADGKVRAVRFRNGGIPDTFFSIPASVTVWRDGERFAVSGYVTTDSLSDGGEYQAQFRAYTYGKNGSLLREAEVSA